MSIDPYPGLAAAQPFDATLQALAVLPTSADTAPYFTGVDTAALMTVTPFARTLFDDVDQATARTTLGLGTMAQQNAGAVAITGGAATVASLTSTFDVSAVKFDSPDAAGEFQTSFGGHKSVGVNRWNLFCDGTASNYLAGPLSLASPTPEANCRLSIRWMHAAPGGILLRVTDSDTGVFGALSFANLAGTTVGSITQTASATAYNTSSDARLKEAIATLQGALDVIRALRPVAFRWQADGSKGNGFLAHELQQVVPEAVSGEADAVNDDGSIRPQQVDHSRLVVFLVGAVQELLKRVEALEAAPA
jgi:hypothetical protein